MLARLSVRSARSLRSIRSSFAAISTPIRCFSAQDATVSKAARRQGGLTDRLIRTLNSEITAQQEVISEAGEDMQPAAVLEEFNEFLSEGGWKVAKEANSVVCLTRCDEELKGTITIRADLNEVVNSSSFESDAFANEEEDVTEEANEEAEENDFESSYASFPMTLEVTRDAQPGKTLYFDCLAESADDSCTLTVENVSLVEGSEAEAYRGPVYENLDEQLKEAFEAFVAKVVKPEQMVDFIQLYAQAVEAHEYKNWLESVKSVLN